MTAMNGSMNDNSSILVLYKVANSKTDVGGSYNAFRMPRGNAVTLKSVKKSCTALHSLNPAGPDGFHWRVCIEDNRTTASSSTKQIPFSWWDIQDENARLPVKEATVGEVETMFQPDKHNSASTSSSSHHEVSKAAKGGLKMLGKAVNAVVDAGTGGSSDTTSPRIGVIAFKLLDLVKMHDDFDHKHVGSAHGGVSVPKQPRSAVPKQQQHAAARATPARASAPPQQQRPAAPTPAQRRTTAPPRTAAHAPRPAGTARSTPARPAAPAAEASLMNFDSPQASSRKTYQHSNSMPATFSNETRAEKLKREYAQKQSKQNRVWDEVDQRWVDVGHASSSSSNVGSVKRGTTAAPPSSHHHTANNNSGKNVKGISLDASNAAGKSATVQAAVNKRVSEMKESQAKALQEVRERESLKKQEEAEEDAVRKRLEPKIKAWSEEHGKKKQLRALLASLHTILWPEANWKPVGIGDILDDSKVKRCFHKASRVVHPDKTHHLDAEKRFLAKRIFDALSQAKTEFDEGAK